MRGEKRGGMGINLYGQCIYSFNKKILCVQCMSIIILDVGDIIVNEKDKMFENTSRKQVILKHFCLLIF